MAKIILIHGAWHGSWCWEDIVPKLQGLGHDVITPDLPGRARVADKKQIKFKDHIAHVADILHQCEEPVILVGHSMAGMVIAQLAELYPEKIQKLVFLAAFMPIDNESMFDVVKLSPASKFVEYMRTDVERNEFHLDKSIVHEFAYHLCPEDKVAAAITRLNIEPLSPLNTKIKLNENYAKMPKVYIQCTHDRGITLAAQTLLCQRVPCEIYTLNADHSPFYSSADDLAAILTQISGRA